MTPAKFPGHNKVYQKPETWKDGTCGDIEAYEASEEVTVNSPVTFLRWEPSHNERALIAIGKPITLKLCMKGVVPHSLYVEQDAPHEPRTDDPLYWVPFFGMLVGTSDGKGILRNFYYSEEHKEVTGLIVEVAAVTTSKIHELHTYNFNQVKPIL